MENRVNKKKDDLVVSVVMITYNHEKFIGEAIEGVLMQQTSFPFELVICNDGSTDNTHAIIEECIKNKPEGKLIRYFNHQQNLGMVPNFIFALGQGKGKYVALCEGDDYWTDPGKLQKQVDFLEANKGYAICFHESVILNENGEERLYNNIKEDSTFTFSDIAQKNFIATASCVFRNYNHLDPLPAWFKGLAANDWGLKLLNASKGDLYYLKDCMSVYRVHDQGVWSSLSRDQMYQKGMDVIDCLNEAFNFEYQEYFEKARQLRRESFHPKDEDVEEQPVHKRKTVYRRLKNKIIDLKNKSKLK